MLYTCEQCGKIFTQKGHFTYHINRKFPCKVNSVEDASLKNDIHPAKIRQNPVKDYCNPSKSVEKIVNSGDGQVSEGLDKNLKCQYCQRQFKRSDYLKVHIDLKRCKSMKEEEDKQLAMLVEKLHQRLEEQNKALNEQKETIQRLKSSLQEKSISGTTTNHITNNGVIDNR